MSGEYPPSLTDSQFNELHTSALSWSHTHGLSVIPPPASLPATALEQKHEHTFSQHAPVTLFPSPFPRSAFEEGLEVQRAYNDLYVNVVKEGKWLRNVSERLAAVDDFIGGLWKVLGEVEAEGILQTKSLGLFRSDYMVHKPTPSSRPQILQVEFNTIASSFGGLASKVASLHRFLQKAGLYGRTPLPGNIPASSATVDLAAGIAGAHSTYGPSLSGVEKKGILFVVQPGERNIFDQRALEYELLETHGIPVFRLTPQEILSRTELVGPKRALRLNSPDGEPLAELTVVYLRSFYAPTEYEWDRAWETRTFLERSYAIKCPTIITQLSGSKKVQQELCLPGVLEKFISEDNARAVRKTFAKILSFDEGDAGEEARRIAFDEAEVGKYVLKPQREGGGNNIYRNKIPAFLKSIPKEQWPGYILMELIEPPAVENVVLRNGAVERGGVIGELGIYGTALWDEKEVLRNEAAGYLLRTKGRASEEGGVAAGFGCVDSVLLVDE